MSEKGSSNCSFCSVTMSVTDGRTECLKCSGPPDDPSAYEQQTLPTFLLSISRTIYNISLNYCVFPPIHLKHVLLGLYFPETFSFDFFPIKESLKMFIQTGISRCQLRLQTC